MLVYKLGKESLPATVSVGPFVYWVIFYFIGVYLSDKNRDYSLIWPVSLIVVGFVAQLFETKYLISCGNVGVGLKLSSWIYSVGMVLLLFSNKIEQFISRGGSVYQMLVKIGGISFGVYLTHVYFLIIVNFVLHTTNWIVYFITVSLMTTLFVMVLKAVLPVKFWRVLGLN